MENKTMLTETVAWPRSGGRQYSGERSVQHTGCKPTELARASRASRAHSAWLLLSEDVRSYLGGDSRGRAGHEAGDGLTAAGGAGSRGRGRRGQPGGHHWQWQEAGPGTEAAGCAATGPGGGTADAGGAMRPVGTPLAAVPAHPVISFEAAVVPGHLDGPWRLLTGKQRPDLLAQSGEEGDLDKYWPC